MSSPYREMDRSAPAPLEELAWRREMVRSAGWAAGLLAGETVLLIAIPFLPLHVAPVGLAAWCVLGAGAAVATWLLTAPEPRSAVGWQGWLLRVMVPAYLGLTGLILLYVTGVLDAAPEAAHHLLLVAAMAAQIVTGAPLVVATTVYVWRFARFKHIKRRSVVDWLPAAIWALPPALMDALPLGLWIGVAVLAWPAVDFYTLRRGLLPIEQEWWFDNETARPGEWASLFVYGDGVAEVRWIDERPGGFYSREYATAWLQQQGYMPAERALAEHLVDSVPPDILPVARRRKRLRAAVPPQGPRMRVASDDTPDEAADELDDSAALDEPEPQRALAAHDPDDPRA